MKNLFKGLTKGVNKEALAMISIHSVLSVFTLGIWFVILLVLYKNIDDEED